MNQPLLYSKYNGLQRSDAAYVLENYLRLIKWNPNGGDAILDVGCGSGDVTTRMLLPQLPPNFGKLVGVDLSEEMVEFARSQNRNPKVGFSIMDFSSRKLPSECYGQFDHIFSFNCLHWIEDQRQAFKNVYDLLKPGGDMLVALQAGNPIFHLYENMSMSNKWMKYVSDTSSYITPYQHCKDPERFLENLLNEIGFSTHICNVVEMKYVYPDLRNFRKSMIAINPFLGKIPHDHHNDYFIDFIDNMRKMNLIEECNEDVNINEATVRVPYRLVVIVASKTN